MASRQRIGTIKDKERGSVSAYVVEAQNHLLQTRNFAYDGRFWFYQPTSRGPFQQVNTADVPDNAVRIMAAYTGFSEASLRADPHKPPEET